MRSDRYKEESAPRSKNRIRRVKKKGSRALKLLLLLILLLLIAIPATVYNIYKNAAESLYVEINEDKLNVAVGEPLLALDCIKDHGGELFFETGESSYSVIGSHEPVSYDDFYLNTDEIGEHTVSGFIEQPILGGYIAPYETFSFTYKVEDKVPPVVLWSGGAALEKGTEFDIKKVVGYGDNADPSPEVTYTGTVDTNTSGDYPIHVTVTDASGNSTDWDTTVYVVDKMPSYHDSSEKMPFKDFVDKHRAEGREFGIDVSVWQGEIDWNKVKAAGCDFAIIRIGYSEDGIIEFDKRFERNYTLAKEAGIPIGLYMYSYDNSEKQVRQAASQIITQLGGDSLELPIAFDWEDFGQFQKYEMSLITLNRMYDAFADELSKAGYDCMLYGSKTYLEKVWDETDSRPIWLAHYTDQTDYSGPYRIWQASSSGRIDGISGAVDINIMYE